MMAYEKIIYEKSLLLVLLKDYQYMDVYTQFALLSNVHWYRLGWFMTVPCKASFPYDI